MTPKDRAAMARRRAKSRDAGAEPKERQPRFAKCVRNDSNPAALKLGKTYEVIADGKAVRNHMIRVVDELGEDYLYPENYFVDVKKAGR
jgi:hypothetical protein